MSVLVLHTTESDAGTGRAVRDYLLREGKASHRVYDPATGDEYILIQWGTAALSLKNLSGGVETNRRGDVFQVEIVGRAHDVPGYSDDWYRNLGHAVRRWCVQTGTPFTFPCVFQTYPESYGRTNPNRLSNEAWLSVAGCIGHAHVPENDHGDPGGLDVNRLIVLSSETLEALMALEPTTPVTVDGAQYNLIDVIGWTLEGINALRRAATPTSPAAFTEAQIAEAVKRALREGVG